MFAPNAAIVPQLEAYMDELRKSGDSIGARVNVVADGVPAGWGEPIYGKLDGDLAAGGAQLVGVEAFRSPGVEEVVVRRAAVPVGEPSGDREGSYMAPMWTPMTSPVAARPCWWSRMWIGVMVMTATMTTWVRTIAVVPSRSAAVSQPLAASGTAASARPASSAR